MYDARVTGERRPRVDPRVASVLTLRPMITYARTQGVDVTALLTSLGVPTRLEPDLHDQCVPERVRLEAWLRASEESADPFFGLHVAESAGVGAYDVLDHALAVSATLEDAYGRFVRFHRVLADGLAMRMEMRDGLAHLRRLFVTPRHEAEAVAAVLVRRGRELTGRELVVREVRFAHASPAEIGPLEALFRCPIHFGRPSTELVLHASALSYPILGSNPPLAAVLDRYMREIIARLPDDSSFVRRARRAVADAMSNGRPSLAATARLLRASPRTVQRELHDAGTSHRAIVEDVRRELASRFVDASDFSLTEIAFLLGFSDVSGFRRTFKRWTGESPKRARAA